MYKRFVVLVMCALVAAACQEAANGAASSPRLLIRSMRNRSRVIANIPES